MVMLLKLVQCPLLVMIGRRIKLVPMVVMVVSTVIASLDQQNTLVDSAFALAIINLFAIPSMVHGLQQLVTPVVIVFIVILAFLTLPVVMAILARDVIPLLLAISGRMSELVVMVVIAVAHVVVITTVSIMKMVKNVVITVPMATVIFIPVMLPMDHG